MTRHDRDLLRDRHGRAVRDPAAGARALLAGAAVLPVEGRLAADAARSDPGRTAATATALLIGLALVVAVNSLGSSFLKTISDEFDRAFARDLTVQPRGLSPGQGPQQTIAHRLCRAPGQDP